MNKVVIIGAGPAGLMAAYNAACLGADVTVIERNDRTGRKLRITGKGRCNVTNNCTVTEFFAEVPKNPKFLYSAINRFTPSDTIDFFETYGVPLKTERGRRVFPVSDKAHDIADALEKAVCDLGVRIIFGTRVSCILYKDGKVCGVRARNTEYAADAVIVATGGVSYPLTGSTGDGYDFADTAGLEIIPPRPSLVPVITYEHTRELSGLSLKNVTLSVKDRNGNVVYSELGEMLFTHFGLSGPLVLSASAHMTDEIDSYVFEINLKPALDDATLDARLVSDLKKYSARDFSNSLGDLLPRTLIPYIINASAIPPHKKSAEITREERHSLLCLLHALPFHPTAFRPIDEAIVTRGGVAVTELKPGTMEAKNVPGLYFAGEVIDVDAYTGGYNLQIAFATGAAAGTAAAKYADTQY